MQKMKPANTAAMRKLATVELRTRVRAAMNRSAEYGSYGAHAALAREVRTNRQAFADAIAGRRKFSPNLIRQLAKTLKVDDDEAALWQRLGATEAGWRL